MKPITKAQRKAIHRLWLRARSPTQDTPSLATYRQFRRQIVPDLLNDCLMINIWHMWIGIERDGYTHS